MDLDVCSRLTHVVHRLTIDRTGCSNTASMQQQHTLARWRLPRAGVNDRFGHSPFCPMLEAAMAISVVEIYRSYTHNK